MAAWGILEQVPCWRIACCILQTECMPVSLAQSESRQPWIPWCQTLALQFGQVAASKLLDSDRGPMSCMRLALPVVLWPHSIFEANLLELHCWCQACAVSQFHAILQRGGNRFHHACLRILKLNIKCRKILPPLQKRTHFSKIPQKVGYFSLKRGGGKRGGKSRATLKWVPTLSSD